MLRVLEMIIQALLRRELALADGADEARAVRLCSHMAPERSVRVEAGPVLWAVAMVRCPSVLPEGILVVKGLIASRARGMLVPDVIAQRGGGREGFVAETAWMLQPSSRALVRGCATLTRSLRRRGCERSQCRMLVDTGRWMSDLDVAPVSTGMGALLEEPSARAHEAMPLFCSMACEEMDGAESGTAVAAQIHVAHARRSSLGKAPPSEQSLLPLATVIDECPMRREKPGRK